MWENVKSLIASAAPLVGGLLAGPAGSSVGALIADKLGVEHTPEAIEAELKSHPEALLKIKQMESDERVELRKIKLQETSLLLGYEQSKLADTQDARKQHKDHWMPWALTLILAVMVGGMFAALFFGDVPENYSQVLIMIAGTVLGAFSTGIAYWLGSSQGSLIKGKQLAGGVNGK
ncbi:hypothetical protein VSP9026_02384 [Vibrio spartinae]|uniref:Uncharacterized protein n=2 Tax=Vibrio spartinae TaxID=1918945 RepID=A0A1N6M5F8_9VIBR|nr:hypothetical protein [Vibrio spartinae]SIO94655.1 hypothetical protein VSP9026_02384 [Vibrio spartinae]